MTQPKKSEKRRQGFCADEQVGGLRSSLRGHRRAGAAGGAGAGGAVRVFAGNVVDFDRRDAGRRRDRGRLGGRAGCGRHGRRRRAGAPASGGAAPSFKGIESSIRLRSRAALDSGLTSSARRGRGEGGGTDSFY